MDDSIPLETEQSELTGGGFIDPLLGLNTKGGNNETISLL